MIRKLALAAALVASTTTAHAAVDPIPFSAFTFSTAVCESYGPFAQMVLNNVGHNPPRIVLDVHRYLPNGTPKQLGVAQYVIDLVTNTVNSMPKIAAEMQVPAGQYLQAQAKMYADLPTAIVRECLKHAEPDL